MLTASVSGRLYASPPASIIVSTIMNVARLNQGIMLFNLLGNLITCIILNIESFFFPTIDVFYSDKGGVLVMILNYSGDVLNFGVAIEEARNRGVKVFLVLILI